MRKLVLTAMLASCTAVTQSAESVRFDDSNIRLTIRTLASDAFGGRAPATPGEKLTTDYIVSRFKQYGLLPANRGSFLQKVPLLEITADPAAVLTLHGGKLLSLKNGTDVVVNSPRPRTTVALINSAVVFAGYGIVAPEYQWNDYAGLDVRGKTVVVLVNDPGYATGDPKLFHGKAMTYYGRWTYKYEEAARHGAAAVLIVHDTEPAGYPWQVVQNTFKGPQAKLPVDDEYELKIQGWLSREGAGRLFAAAGLNLDALARAATLRGFKPIALKLTANLTLQARVRAIATHNVVALLKGSKHAGQAVVYTAHWDHLGTKIGPDGKRQIFHGAVDNASGVAGLLELARVYAQAESAPARSVLFIATAAEEQGHLGAAYYVRHPLFPLSDTVANLNMDVMNLYGETRDLTVRGGFMSTLDDKLQQVARRQGRNVFPDAELEKGFYFRGDNFEFARNGVPALTIDGGPQYVGRPAGWGAAQLESYISERYHKPADVYDAGWDLAGLREQLDVLYLVGRQLADSTDWPTWYRDIPFRATREAQRGARK